MTAVYKPCPDEALCIAGDACAGRCTQKIEMYDDQVDEPPEQVLLHDRQRALLAHQRLTAYYRDLPLSAKFEFIQRK